MCSAALKQLHFDALIWLLLAHHFDICIYPYTSNGKLWQVCSAKRSCYEILCNSYTLSFLTHLHHMMCVKGWCAGSLNTHPMVCLLWAERGGQDSISEVTDLQVVAVSQTADRWWKEQCLHRTVAALRYSGYSLTVAGVLKSVPGLW